MNHDRQFLQEPEKPASYLPWKHAQSEFAPGDQWLGRDWMLLRYSMDCIISQLIDAVRSTNPVQIRYTGGTGGLGLRSILPAMVFGDVETIEFPRATAYCLAWCAEREAPRLFRTDRIQNLIQSSVPQENFPYYRALAEIEYEIHSRFRIKGDALEILTPEYSTDRSLPPIHEQYL